MGVIGYFTNIVFSAMILSTSVIQQTQGLLYPHESESREVRKLDGIWNFLKSDPDNPSLGIKMRWFDNDLSVIGQTIDMPVPASFNDITDDSSLRDHVGTVWYDRKFFVPAHWQRNALVWLRFGSVHYAAIVWINGVQCIEHQIGHLPFEAEVSAHLNFGQENRITVLVDNVLLATTIPQGSVSYVDTDTGRQKIQSYTFDFFNYAGIHRSVHLYTTPRIYISDVELESHIDTIGEGSSDVLLNYQVNVPAAEAADNVFCQVNVLNKNNSVVATNTLNEMHQIRINNAVLWWPYLMHPDPGYMYTIEVRLSRPGEKNVDTYRLKYGFRTLTWDNAQFLINMKPIYFRGFGRHEDSDIRGKGLDLVLLTKDLNLLKWTGANAYRTSHYPYSEESMQFADENGIMIIDECSSVDTTGFSKALLDNHKKAMEQLIHRDRNHPSVVMWSVANEPRTGELSADAYFKEIVRYTKSLDSTRPVTAAIATPLFKDFAAQHMDIISFNRYNGWYQNPGLLDTVSIGVLKEATMWHERHKKLILMSEYGADTLEGLHIQPAFIWSEEYQKQILSRHFQAFDKLRSMNFFIGEFIWNFADFKTAQTYTRVGGNKKGIFTRSRQPKDAATLVRQRYHALAHEQNPNVTMPLDITHYYIGRDVTGSSCSTKAEF